MDKPSSLQPPAAKPAPCRRRRITLRDGREVILRAIAESDASEIEQAFGRLSDDSRYARFMQHKKQLDAAALERGLHPRVGREFVFVATVPAPDGIDIVGAAQYVPANDDDRETCEFALTVAEDWRGSGLAAQLLQSLVKRAQRDGYTTIEGWVMRGNTPMLALARSLGFEVEPVPDDASLMRVHRALHSPQARRPPRQDR